MALVLFGNCALQYAFATRRMVNDEEKEGKLKNSTIEEVIESDASLEALTQAWIRASQATTPKKHDLNFKFLFLSLFCYGFRKQSQSRGTAVTIV
jgi:hypothetical protein